MAVTICVWLPVWYLHTIYEWMWLLWDSLTGRSQAQAEPLLPSSTSTSTPSHPQQLLQRLQQLTIELEQAVPPSLWQEPPYLQAPTPTPHHTNEHSASNTQPLPSRIQPRVHRNATINVTAITTSTSTRTGQWNETRDSTIATTPHNSLATIKISAVIIVRRPPW